MNIIAIDCGASFIKCALICDGIVDKKISKKSPAISDIFNPYKAEWIKNLVEEVENIIADISNDLDTFCLCISNEMHGFLLAQDDGTPVTDYISWQRELGAIPIDDLTSVDFLKENISKTDLMYTGMNLRAGLPISNLTFIMRDREINTGQRYRFYTLGDYILKCIVGYDVSCHPTNAAATGLFDLRTGTWNENIARFFNDICIFPRVEDGIYDFVFNEKKCSYKPAIGDQQAALLGSGLINEGELSFNLGTGAQVSTLVSELDCGKTYQIRPYFNGKYLKTLPHLPSGRACNVYIRFIQDLLNTLDIDFNEKQIWEKILDSVSDNQQYSLKIDLSFFENPLTDRTTGYIDEISEYSLTVSNLFGSVFESMSDNFVKAAKIITDINDINKIFFSGGVARKNKYLRNSILKKIGMDISYEVSEDETLSGLAIYGGN